ncbi:MAG: hypothetical protein ABIK18_04990 [candidate division WOR-3 bacterium]
MDRRNFLKLLLGGGATIFLDRGYGQRLLNRGNRLERFALPPPVVNTFSTEICLNSRRSYHSGYSGSLSDQILANVLWAASKAPLMGSSRIIYVARSDNVYRYDPAQHDIILHLAGNHMSESNLAFEVGITGDFSEDAGTALFFAKIASFSFWTSTTNQPSACVKESGRSNAQANWNPTGTIHMVCCFGRMPTVSGMTSQLVAISSNGTLPNPTTNGTVLLENALNNLKYGNQFLSTELTLQQISQIAYASYGNTPHTSTNGRAALTVPSAVANYYLTARIYIVRSEGVERYHIRTPGGGNTTRDHRIERVTTGDRRPNLRSAVPRLPQTAPNYFVYCAAQAANYQLQEAGYAGASALLQASSMVPPLQGYFTANFTSSERTAIINALGIPSADLPLFIFSVGTPASLIEEGSSENRIHIKVSPNPFRDKTEIRLQIPDGEDQRQKVRLDIYDGAGRVVKSFAPAAVLIWDGKDNRGIPVAKGSYLCVLRIGRTEYRQRIIKI